MVAERLQSKWEYAEPAVEVVPKPSSHPEVFEGRLSGGDHTHIYGNNPRAADPHHVQLCSTRSRRAWRPMGISATSSRNTLLRWASSNRPGFPPRRAPLKAPPS